MSQANEDGGDDIWKRRQRREEKNERANQRLQDGFDILREAGDGEEDDDDND